MGRIKVIRKEIIIKEKMSLLKSRAWLLPQLPACWNFKKPLGRLRQMGHSPKKEVNTTQPLRLSLMLTHVLSSEEKKKMGLLKNRTKLLINFS